MTAICLEQGYRIPRGYGIAYYDPRAQRAVCYPLGVNIAVHYARRAYHWLKVKRVPSLLDAHLIEGERRGINSEREIQRQRDERDKAMYDRIMAQLTIQ